MSRLKGWWRGEDDEGHIWNRRLILFPSLSYLRISDCPSLKSLLWLFPIQTNFKLSENNNGNRPPEIIDLQEEEEEEEEIKVRGLEKLEIDNADYIKSMFVSCQSSKCISKDDSHIPGKSLVNHNQSLCYLRLEWLEDVHLPIAANHAHLLTSLHTLYFDMCKNLEALPEWIGNLSSLQHLIIEDCHKIKSLPKSMSKLTSLQSLRIQTINSDFLE